MNGAEDTPEAAASRARRQAVIDQARAAGVKVGMLKAENIVRERIAKTSWAGDARVLRLAADAIKAAADSAE